MTNEIAWLDKDRNVFKMNQISDRYLKNILGFLCRGGGHTSFLDADKITNLFREASRRRLEHPYKLTDAIHALSEKEDLQAFSYLLEEDYYLDRDF